MRGAGSSIAYAASKGALNTLTVSMARALAPQVRVNALCPGGLLELDAQDHDRGAVPGTRAPGRDRIPPSADLAGRRRAPRCSSSPTRR